MEDSIESQTAFFNVDRCMIHLLCKHRTLPTGMNNVSTKSAMRLRVCVCGSSTTNYRSDIVYTILKCMDSAWMLYEITRTISIHFDSFRAWRNTVRCFLKIQNKPFYSFRSFVEWIYQEKNLWAVKSMVIELPSRKLNNFIEMKWTDRIKLHVHQICNCIGALLQNWCCWYSTNILLLITEREHLDQGGKNKLYL